jgi:hypothetical protein
MRRYALLAALLAAVTAAPAVAHEGHVHPGTLDGKTKTSWPFTAEVEEPQQHLLAETDEGNPVDPDVTLTTCAYPRCYAFPFTVKPARGVSPRTSLSVKVSWTLPTSRFWLKLVDLNKKTPVVRAECSTYYVTAGTSATVRVSSLKPGKYAAWVTAQQVVAPDTLTGVVSFPGKDTPGADPAPSPGELFVSGCNA